MLCSLPAAAATKQGKGLATPAATDVAAAKKRKKQPRPAPRISEDASFLTVRGMTHQAERAQIACLPGGCQPIPKGCLREPGRTFTGEMTGFDMIACPPR
jgi:hypothetical protein